MSKRGQTATEYLIIIAVVIIIAVIVISILGDVNILQSNVKNSQLANIGSVVTIEAPVISPQYAAFTFLNRKDSAIILTSIVMENYSCSIEGTPLTVKQFGSTEIICYGFSTNFSDQSVWDMDINWTDTKTDADYTQSFEKVSFAVADSLPQKPVTFVASGEYFFYAADSTRYITDTGLQSDPTWLKAASSADADKINSWNGVSWDIFWHNGATWKKAGLFGSADSQQYGEYVIIKKRASSSSTTFAFNTDISNCGDYTILPRTQCYEYYTDNT